MLPVVGADWLAQVPIDEIEVYGDFLDQYGDVVHRVRKSAAGLRVTVSRPTSTMLSTGDPAQLALSDVHVVLNTIAKRFSIGWTPTLPGLSAESSAAADVDERQRGHMKALAVELIRARSATLGGVDLVDVDGQLGAGLYSQALGALLRASRTAGVPMPEAIGGDLQRMRVELRAHDL